MIELNRTEADDYCWITYKDDNNLIGYEIAENENDIVVVFKSKILADNLSMRDILNDILWSENDMFYIDEDAEENFSEVLLKLEQDIKLFPQLKKYITFYPEDTFVDGRSVGIDNGILTEVLFNSL